MYQAVIARIRTRPHPNADRLLLGDCAGFQVVVGKDTKDGDLGVFFPADGQLSEEYAKANDLIAVRDAKGKHVSGGFFGEDRRVRAQTFRGSRSEGYWAPVSSLYALAPGEAKEGETLNAWKGVPLCERYETEATKVQRERSAARATREIPGMPKHYDTKNLRFMPDVGERSLVFVTEKLHGTSQRTALVREPAPEGRIAGFFRRLLKLPAPTRLRWVTGSRNVTFTGAAPEQYRNEAAARFMGRLLPGEVVYYEIVGYAGSGKPIMNPQDTRPQFGAEYGPKMVYSYGCEPGEHEVYVYRMTRHEDGREREYTFLEIARRCEEIGVSYVPLLTVFTVGMQLLFRQSLIRTETDALLEGHSSLDNRHIREGVCVRLEGLDSGAVAVYKSKAYTFGVLEGYLKDTGVADAEEAA